MDKLKSNKSNLKPKMQTISTINSSKNTHAHALISTPTHYTTRKASSVSTKDKKSTAATDLAALKNVAGDVARWRHHRARYTNKPILFCASCGSKNTLTKTYKCPRNEPANVYSTKRPRTEEISDV